MLQKALAFARENVVLTSVQNALGGFGVALLLQWYIQGAAFAPMWLGWVFVAFSVAIHIYEIGLGFNTHVDDYDPHHGVAFIFVNAALISG